MNRSTPKLGLVPEPQIGRHRDLHREAQDVVLAALQVVELAPHPQQEIQRLQALGQLHGREQVQRGEIRDVGQTVTPKPQNPKTPKPQNPSVSKCIHHCTYIIVSNNF